MNAICGRLHKKEPLLVRLSTGAAQEAARQDLAGLLGLLHLHPALPM